ncbi:mechanosensitive ion channel domain-containing protein [Pontiella sp.]|uniref:mechanosensitive ion channel domain-containing protein n=1 Tax=Pontiella sp. TaxID=2837462 RepID=UPI003569309F
MKIEPNLLRLIYSVCFLVLNYCGFLLFKRSAKKTHVSKGLRQSRYFAIRKLLRLLSFGIAVVGLILIWGLSFRHVWLTVSSAVAVIAIAFFAVWSLVGNILAGILLFFTTPFRIEDVIEVMPDGIKGQVLAINTFYTVLRNEELDYINVPNSLFFQKYIRVQKHAASSSAAPAGANEAAKAAAAGKRQEP